MASERPKTLQTIEGLLYICVLTGFALESHLTLGFALSIVLESKANANVGYVWGYDVFGNPILYTYVAPWVNFVLFTVQLIHVIQR